MYVLPFLCKFKSSAHLCYCLVNAKQQYFACSIADANNLEVHNNSLSTCNRQNGSCYFTMYSVTQWSKKRPDSPFNFLDSTYASSAQCNKAQPKLLDGAFFFQFLMHLIWVGPKDV